jgi:hypothetical protein
VLGSQCRKDASASVHVDDDWEADQQGIQDTDHQSAAAVFFRSVSSREREKLTSHFACREAYRMGATLARNQSGRSMNDMTWAVPASFLNRSFSILLPPIL